MRVNKSYELVFAAKKHVKRLASGFLCLYFVGFSVLFSEAVSL